MTRSMADIRLHNGRAENHTRTLRNPNGEWDIINSTLGHHVIDVLDRNFPGHPWSVEAEVEQGVCKIGIKGFEQWQHVIHVKSLKGDPKLTPVVRAGGELLERLGMPRTGFSIADWRSALQKYPIHFNRHSKPPTG